MVLLYAYCHCGSSSVVRHCDPQEKGIERLPADGKAGLRMKEGECGIGVSFMDRLYWVACEAAPRNSFKQWPAYSLGLQHLEFIRLREQSGLFF